MVATAISVNLSLITIQENEVTKRLAAYAALVAVPTMVAGVYGMNFANMPELQWAYGYPAALATMVLDRSLSRVSLQEGQVDVIPLASSRDSADALCFASARDLAEQIRSRQVSCREVMTAFLAQIERLNPHLNAIVAKLDDDACLALADKADHALGNGGPIGPLHGLPTAFKDLEPAVGFPQSKGSPIFRNFMPDADSVMVERIRRAGAIPIGKTNVPEFGMGSQTYNRVYGTTLQSVRPHQDRRRIERRCGGGGCDGHVADRRRRRSRRLASQSGELQQHCCAAAERRTGAQSRRSRFRSSEPVNERHDGAIVSTMLRSAERHGRRRCPRSAISSTSRVVCRRRSSGIARGARVAWCPDLGGLPLDPRVRQIIEGTTQDIRGSRLRRRRRVP